MIMRLKCHFIVYYRILNIKIKLFLLPKSSHKPHDSGYPGDLNIRISPAPGTDYGEGRKARALDICSTKVKIGRASPWRLLCFCWSSPFQTEKNKIKMLLVTSFCLFCSVAEEQTISDLTELPVQLESFPVFRSLVKTCHLTADGTLKNL